MPVGVNSTSKTLANAVPFQYRPPPCRRLTRTVEVPDPVSTAVPQMSPTPPVPQPAVKLVALYVAPETGKVMATTGGVESMIQVYDAGLDRLPTRSIALTWMVRAPSASPVWSLRRAQAVKRGILTRIADF